MSVAYGSQPSQPGSNYGARDGDAAYAQSSTGFGGGGLGVTFNHERPWYQLDWDDNRIRMLACGVLTVVLFGAMYHLFASSSTAPKGMFPAGTLNPLPSSADCALAPGTPGCPPMSPGTLASSPAPSLPSTFSSPPAPFAAPALPGAAPAPPMSPGQSPSSQACTDQDPAQCPTWATANPRDPTSQCMINSEYMKTTCRKSCGICSKGGLLNPAQYHLVEMLGTPTTPPPNTYTQPEWLDPLTGAPSISGVFSGTHWSCMSDVSGLTCTGVLSTTNSVLQAGRMFVAAQKDCSTANCQITGAAMAVGSSLRLTFLGMQPSSAYYMYAVV